MKRTALVVGATGLIGKNVVHQLVENDSYEKVTIFVRKQIGITHKKLEEVIVNFDQLENYKQYFYVHDVFSCLGTTIKIAKTKENFRKVDYEYSIKVAELSNLAKVQNFLIISSMGANSQSNIFYSKVKGEVEKELNNFNFKALFIFRPSLLLGKREEVRLGEKFAENVSKILPFLFSGIFKKYKPIKGDIVAKAMVFSALSNLEGKRIFESNEIEKIAKMGK